MEIIICVGSSCHLKGSHEIIKELERLIEQNNFKDKIILKASFCMGRCTEGVSITVDGRPVNCLTIDNVEEFFYEKIAGRVSP